jgi:hypothetical protein
MNQPFAKASFCLLLAGTVASLATVLEIIYAPRHQKQKRLSPHLLSHLSKRSLTSQEKLGGTQSYFQKAAIGANLTSFD